MFPVFQDDSHTAWLAFTGCLSLWSFHLSTMRVDLSAGGLLRIDLMMCVIWLLFWSSSDALRLAQGVGELGTECFDSAYILNNNRRQAIFFHSLL